MSLIGWPFIDRKGLKLRRNSAELGTRAAVVRKATRADTEEIIDLIVGLAKFERLRPPDRDARIRLVEDIFDKRLVNVLVAQVSKKLAGYALYFYTYSSFLAQPSLFLEDIFVREENRGEGIGEALFRRCIDEAYRHGCGRMNWEVLDWNRKARRFYENFGAKMVDDMRLFRLDEKSLMKLARKSNG